MLKGKKIVVGITGSIAAYKVPFFVRLLVKEGADVRIIMTPAARDFVTPLTLATLSQHAVIIDTFNPENGEWSNHVELGLWADAMIFAPVTANTLGKMAHGIADNFVVTAYLSAKCPVFIAPAMDLDMYAHPSTTRNIEILRSYGNFIIEPQVGELASGLSGPGRLEEPDAILRIVRDHLTQQKDLNLIKFLITAGPTYEKLDPVRFIGNYSTGKMGFSLAQEAASRGAIVTLVAGPTNLASDHPNVKQINVESAAEMFEVCIREAPLAEIVIMAAAVSDYTCLHQSVTKLKKTTDPFTLELSPTPDILKEIGRNKTENQVLVGFALETDNELEHAKSKLAAKNLDFIVLNSLSEKGSGFGLLTNKICILDHSGIVHQGTLKNKSDVAADIIDCIVKNRTIQP